MGRGRTQDCVKCSKLLLGERGIHSPSTPRLHVQSISGYMRSSYMTCHITGGFSLPEGARERSIRLFVDDQVGIGHFIGQILQMWQRSQQQSSNMDS